MKTNDEPIRDKSHNIGTDYCHKLKGGINRLKEAIFIQYANSLPNEIESIKSAIAEAETAAWSMPFPSLFFPPLAHIRINQMGAQAATD
ncbi:MAG: hypothetical protein JWO45_441 [Spartobacteria bacterium]|nr:hypothetical protein [Spartobacteria bacterium]